MANFYNNDDYAEYGKEDDDSFNYNYDYDCLETTTEMDMDLLTWKKGGNDNTGYGHIVRNWPFYYFHALDALLLRNGCMQRKKNKVENKEENNCARRLIWKMLREHLREMRNLKILFLYLHSSHTQNNSNIFEFFVDFFASCNLISLKTKNSKKQS